MTTNDTELVEVVKAALLQMPPSDTLRDPETVAEEIATTAIAAARPIIEREVLEGMLEPTPQMIGAYIASVRNSKRNGSVSDKERAAIHEEKAKIRLRAMVFAYAKSRNITLGE